MSCLMDLFALTARGGRRNHVFLLPDNTEATRRNVEARAEEVQRAVERGRQSPTTAGDFIVAWRRVSQTTSGRLGYEWLCLAGPAVRAFPQVTRKALESWLEERLADLDAIVARHDWNHAEELFEVIPELADWQRDVRSNLARFPASSPRRSSQEGPLRGSRPSRRRWVAALLVLFVLTAAWSRLGRPLRHCWQGRTLDGPTHRDGRIHDDGPTHDDWRKFAEGLGLPDLPSDPHGLKRHLATKLRNVYSDVPGDQPPEKVVEKILQAFEKDCNQTGTESLKKLISSGPRRELKELFREGEFNPMGLVDWPDEDKKFWKDMEPQCVNQLLKPVTDNSGAWSAPDRNTYQELANWYPMVEHLQKYCQDQHRGEALKCQSDRSGMIRRFYKREDHATSQKLKKLLQNLARAGAINSGRRPPHTAVECVRSVVDAIGGKGENRKSLKEVTREKYPAFADAAAGLLRLREEWSKVLHQQGGGATPADGERAPDR